MWCAPVHPLVTLVRTCVVLHITQWALDIVDNALPAVSLDAADGAADAAVSHMRDWALGSDGRCLHQCTAHTA